MQIIANFLQIITEGFTSVIEYLKQSWSDFAQLADWLGTALNVGRNLVVWCPDFLRDVMSTMLSVFVALRFIGRD